MFQALISFFKTTREKFYSFLCLSVLPKKKNNTKTDRKYFDRIQRGREKERMKKISSKLPTQEFKLQKNYF